MTLLEVAGTIPTSTPVRCRSRPAEPPMQWITRLKRRASSLEERMPEFVLAVINSSHGQSYFWSKAKRITNPCID